MAVRVRASPVSREVMRHPELAIWDPLTRLKLRELHRPPKHFIECSKRVHETSKKVSSEFTCQAGVATAHEYLHVFSGFSELQLCFMATFLLTCVLRYLKEM